MADTHETIADIIAEMRALSNPISDGIIAINGKSIADRLEAAHRRERGDCAKLREALKLCMDEMCNRCRDLAAARGNPLPCLQGCEPVRKAKVALAAPPRNCDKYATADEALKAQEQMFNNSNFANGECKLGCPECDNPRVGCKIAWLYAPTTEQEGGAK